jgi:hypothetical protein
MDLHLVHLAIQACTQLGISMTVKLRLDNLNFDIYFDLFYYKMNGYQNRNLSLFLS